MSYVMVGIDLVYIPEFKKRLSEPGVLEKLFTASELEQFTTLESRAGVFAAKEAFMKAMGKKLNWLDIWIEKNELEKPTINFRLSPVDFQTDISISHSGEYVTAVVMI